MEAINLVLIGVIAYVIYLLTVKNKSDDRAKLNEPNNKKKSTKQINDKELIDDMISWDTQSNDSYNSYDFGVVTKEVLNPNFLNIQFHNDYRDVMTALNNIVPDKKQFFNLANIPVIYSQPEVNEVAGMVRDFINVLNENLKSEVPHYRHSNTGWDEAIQDPRVKSGWDKVQDSLGLPVSIYEDPAPKSPVKLVSIRSVDKYETEDEIKFSCDIVIQKLNVEDQMIIRTSFVQDKRALHNENNFFVQHTVEMKVMIEELFIAGYLSNHGNDYRRQQDDIDKQIYFDYNKMEYNDMTDPKYIQQVLMDNYKRRSEEIGHRNSLLDEEGQAFHQELPHIYDFSNIKGTQTIFDDMNYHREFI